MTTLIGDQGWATIGWVDSSEVPDEVFIGAGVILDQPLSWWDSTSLILDLLSIKYPHRCFNQECKVELSFQELLDRNASVWLKHLDCNVIRFYDYKKYKELKRLWKSKYVQFYCCRCYKVLNGGKD